MAGKQVTELDALPSFTDNSLLPVHNGSGLKKGLLSQLANYLGTKFSNPNLLINPDFKINQRGQITYSATGAFGTVDRWLGTNAKVDVNSDNTVTVSSLSGIGYYTQHEESISYGKHTYSIYVQAITGTVKAFYKNKDSEDIELVTLKQGLNTFTSSDDGFKSFFLVIEGGSSVTLKYAKVEQGTVATSFVAPNPAEELVKCRRYYNFIVGHFYGPANPEGFINEDLATLRDFRTSPTFNINSTFSNGVTESSLVMKGSSANGYYLYARTVTSGKYGLDVTIRADAEIY